MSDMDDTNTGLAKAGDTKEKDTGGSNRKSLPDYYAIAYQAKAAEAARDAEQVNSERACSEIAEDDYENPEAANQQMKAEEHMRSGRSHNQRPSSRSLTNNYDQNAAYATPSRYGSDHAGDRPSSCISSAAYRSGSGHPTPSLSGENQAQPQYMSRHQSRHDMFRPDFHVSYNNNTCLDPRIFDYQYQHDPLQITQMNYQGHFDPHPYQLTSYRAANYMGDTMRPRQFPVFPEMAYEDEDMIDVVSAAPSQHTYIHRSRDQPQYKAGFDEDAGRPSRNLGRRHKRSSPTADLAKSTKRKSKAPKKTFVESVEENFDVNAAQTVNSDDEEELFISKEDTDMELAQEGVDEDSDEERDEEMDSDADEPDDSEELASEVSEPPRRPKRGRPSSYPAMPGGPEFKTSMAKKALRLKQLAEEAKRSGGVSGNPGVSKPTIRGRKPHWDVHAEPKMVDAEYITAAGKRKRGIAKNKKGKVFANSTGVSNPENIRIVNMKDIDGKSFKEIARKINQDRVRHGREPNQTGNSVNCRYNRTAPWIYQAQGIKFIRICDRANARGEKKYTMEQEALIWDNDLDMALIEYEEEYCDSKWLVIAERMQELTREDWPTATEVATRFSHL